MPEELIIETRDLSYVFGDQEVLNKVSLQVKPGDLYGLLGVISVLVKPQFIK